MSEVLKIFGLLLILASVSSAYGQEFSCDAIEEYLDCTGSKTADIAIVMDCTGSMGGTINTMRGLASSFVAGLPASGISYQLGLTSYRDYDLACGDYEYCGSPGDWPYEVYGLTTNDAEWQGWLDGLVAGGGADGPESVLAAMIHTATDMGWRDEAQKVAILMCDAPPHDDGHCCNAMDETYADMIAALTAAEVKVYVVFEDYDSWDPTWAINLASATGGKFYDINSAPLEEILADITEDVACTITLESEAECSGDTVKICTKILGKEDMLLPYSEGDTEASAMVCGSEYPLAYDAETESYCAEVPACEVPFDIVVSGRVCEWENTETITVDECNLPPDCSMAYPSVDIIWPPNHEFVPVDILGVTDPDEDAITINIDEIWQDEPVDTNGDGSFVPDGMGIGTPTAQVRAERSGTEKVPGDGRVYHISFTATDEYGATCEGEVTVGVPHDKKDTPVDGGPLYDSTEGE